MGRTRKIVSVVIVMMLIVVGLVGMYTEDTDAAETTVIVDLQKKIKRDLKEINKIALERDTRVESLEKEIEKVVEELESTTDEDRQDKLRQKYAKLRALQLEVQARSAVKIRDRLERVIKNMTALDEKMRRSTKGMMLSGKENIKAVGTSMKGLAYLFAPIAALKGDDRRAKTLYISLMKLNASYENLTSSKSPAVSLKDQIRYMEDIYGFILATLQTVRVEKDFLEANVYVLLSDGIVKTINNSIALLVSPVMDKEKKNHDIKVFKVKRRSVGPDIEINLNPEEIGNYGG